MTLSVKLNRDRKSLSGKYPVVVQLIIARKRALIYTGVNVFPEEFDSHKKNVCFVRGVSLSRKCTEDQKRCILHVRNIVESTLQQMMEQSQSVDVRETAMLCRRKIKGNTLYAVFEKEIAQKYADGKIGTARAYKSTYHKIRLLTRSNDIPIEALTPAFIENFHRLLGKSTCSLNTRGFYIRNLRAVINRYEKQKNNGGNITARLFSGISMRGENTRKRALSVEDMDALIRFDPGVEGGLRLAKDLFLLCFLLRGAALSDLFFMRKGSVKGGYLRFSRHKTAVPLEVEITDDVRVFIDRYRSHNRCSPYLFHFLDNVYDNENKAYTCYRSRLKYINTALKHIGERIGLSVPLTSYVARHTWATQAKASGASLAHISEAIGHRSQQITCVYLKSFDQDVLDKINDKVKAPYKMAIEEMKREKGEVFR